jgi:hypothetical protein
MCDKRSLLALGLIKSRPKMLDSVAVGDKVRFAAEKAGGNFTITAITKAP